MRTFRVLLAMVVAVAGLAACGGDGVAVGEGSRSKGSIRVFAAASLTDAFAEEAEAFESANPGVRLELSFGGSSSLREQMLAGAPADVFASASSRDMDEVVEAGEVVASEVFATNRLQIAVPAGNPAGITGLEDFGTDGLLIGLCAEQVPCGDLGRRVLADAGVRPAPDTSEPDVRALLTKVGAGELDAGLVYVTDVVWAGERVEGIDVPADPDLVATYTIGASTSSGDPTVAAAFVSFVLGEEGQAILERYGFGRP